MIALDTFQVSSLREIGNIGAGHAATALAQLVNRQIRAMIPNVQVVTPGQFLESPFDESSVIGTHLKILGEVAGGILFFFTVGNALKLVDLVVGRGESTSKTSSKGIGSGSGEDRRFPPLEVSALKETGSILSASYLNALSRMMELQLIPSVPRLLTGSRERVFESAFEEQFQGSDGAIGVESVFMEASTSMTAHFFFLPEEESLPMLLREDRVFMRKEGFQEYAAGHF